MTNSTSSSRRSFVERIRETDSIALLDFTRDDYRTVIVATRTQEAARYVRNIAASAGYGIATVWETPLFEYVVFTTTPDSVLGFVDAPAPPSSFVDEALAHFSDDINSQ